MVKNTYLNVCNEKFKSFVVVCCWVEHLVGATILLGQICILPSQPVACWVSSKGSEAGFEEKYHIFVK